MRCPQCRHENNEASKFCEECGTKLVRAFEVLRARGRRARLEVAAERGLTPLVGRERELATIAELFQQVKSGRGQVVFVAGEAGIGKSRLLLEFRRALAQAGEEATWLEGRSISFGQAIPFLPVIDQLRENFGIEELDGEPEIIAKVEHGMRRMGELEAHIPYIRYLLSVDPGEPAVLAIEAQARRKRVFDALEALSLRGARLKPLVLVFEDLHWIDTSTEEYLGSLMDAVAGAPLMVILTYRIGYSPPFGIRSFQTTLTLRSLSEAETLTMAGRVLGTEQFPEELKSALMEKAEGVPLFVEEVTKTLLDLGVLRRENGGYRMVKGMTEVSVPNTIQGIIMARLDRLGEEGKRTVQLASVIGRQFLVRLLTQTLAFLGMVFKLRADFDRALACLHEGSELAERAHAGRWFAMAALFLGCAYLARGSTKRRSGGIGGSTIMPLRRKTSIILPAFPITSAGSIWSSSTWMRRSELTWRRTKWRERSNPGPSRVATPS